MPRSSTAVKNKREPEALSSLGAIDLHFHGAFGIDLMTARPKSMDELSIELWKNGIAAFCPTTLSVSRRELAEAVSRIGRWIESGKAPGARPLGIHLEGPFISRQACGAHPPDAIRKPDFEELQRLWELSRHTLKILTIAPELLTSTQLARLCRWAGQRGIRLSAGHSKASESEANRAFNAGFRGVTHAWNALAFHHRSPGVMGAALGRPDVYLELIADQVHVSPALMDWTCRLHSRNAVCFVSDCVPAAATSGHKWMSFGPLRIRYRDGACRLENGHLAGGGLLLTEAFARWIESQSCHSRDWLKIAKSYINQITLSPLRALGISPARLQDRRVEWRIRSGRLSCRPRPKSECLR